MKLLFLSLLVFVQMSYAQEHKHGHHHEAEQELEAQTPISGSSIFQLASEWKNQKGESVKISSLQGSPRLVVMLFTRCETACPLIVEDLKDITRDLEAKTKEKMKVSIFSLDSFRETPESLATFVKKRKLPSHWELYTSNADAVAELAAALGVRYKRLANGDFIHSNIIYFVSREGEIVSQKEGIKTPREVFVKNVSAKLSAK